MEECAIVFVWTSEKEANEILEQIYFTLEAQGKYEWKIMSSFGMATYESMYHQKNFLKEADWRLYMGKKQGHNRIIGNELNWQIGLIYLCVCYI